MDTKSTILPTPVGVTSERCAHEQKPIFKRVILSRLQRRSDDKAIPFSFDIGNLVCNDANPLPPVPSNADLSASAQACAQALINQILTSCRFRNSPSKGTLVALPRPSTILPRAKPLPKAKPETKWEKFARQKGIKSVSKKSKKQFDDSTGQWMPAWGYKGRKKEHEQNWVTEVDEQKETELNEGETLAGRGRRERRDRAKKNQHKQKVNHLKAKKRRAK